MNKLIFAMVLVLSTGVAIAKSGGHSGASRSGGGHSSHAGSGGAHSVRGYTKKNGTYVAPHRATNPDKSKANNWSSKGNRNPDTGKPGTKDPNKWGGAGMQSLIECIAARPKLFRNFGKTLVNVTGFLLVVAVIGRAALVALAAGAGIAKAPAPTSLRAAYPTLPTWWIPEKPVSIAILALLFVAALAITIVAKRYLRAPVRNR
jgi:hypothetical protein